MATGKVIIYKGIPYFSDVKVPTRVSQLANDAGYVTTDEKVKQSPSDSTDAEYRILFSNTADDTERTEKVQKNSNLTYNTLKSSLKIGAPFSISGVTGSRDTTIDVRGIKISEYVGDSLYGRLELQYRDIFLDSKWDGTNTSLKSSITSLKQSLSNKVIYRSGVTTMIANNTYDITSAISNWSDSIYLIISFRRFGYFCSFTVFTYDIKEGVVTNGYAMPYATFGNLMIKISTTGVLTLVTNPTSDAKNVDICAVF